MNLIDCRQMLCPKPVIEVRKILISAPDAPLSVLVEDAVAKQNLQRLAASLGWAVQESRIDNLPSLEFTPTAAACAVATTTGTTVVLVGAMTMGIGNDELGHILLRNFLLTLTELEIPPTAIYFVNEGVKLSVQGSECVEILQKLANIGIDIAACGLCLDFFKLKGELAVGRTTNMLDIVQSMANAGRVLRP